MKSAIKGRRLRRGTDRPSNGVPRPKEEEEEEEGRGREREESERVEQREERKREGEKRRRKSGGPPSRNLNGDNSQIVYSNLVASIFGMH